MQEDVNELLEAFLSLCLEQRQLTRIDSTATEEQKEDLKNSSMKLAQKLYTKAAELERSGDFSKGKIYRVVITRNLSTF